MELTFSWVRQKRGGEMTPYCGSVAISKDGVSPLACLLMDDGGQGHLCTVPWIDEGIARIYAVIKSEAIVVNWDREAWGAKLSSNGVEVYSLYDEGYFEVIAISMFLHALLAWREFIQSTPQLGVILEVDI
ncbi:hypothetical protein CJO79_18575 (plasmid) [Ralstonia solanacearum]|nr:hypothetical protein CJO76_18590 [Ralstonia solanacearum]AXV94020.1 hypothetical protein CJO79_18575 [Ralstonia solanacearum]AXW22006.1 hypothetical protein CJO85_18640 [Ralstonia solanacearum]AXW78915.1 hypothetical protein CJO97_18570 [Ralstonia solanacearum]